MISMTGGGGGGEGAHVGGWAEMGGTYNYFRTHHTSTLKYFKSI